MEMDKLARLLLLVVCLVSTASSTLVNYKDCGSATGKVISVDVTPCDNPSMCSLKKETSPKITINFLPNKKITSVKVKVTGILPGGIHAPFPLDNPDGCKTSGLACPLNAGDKQSYFTTVYIKKIYPDFRVIVQFELIDQDGKDLACVMIPAKITPASAPASFVAVRRLRNRSVRWIR